MKVANILLGILMIFCAFSILAFPVATGAVVCWFVIAAMMASGIVSIIRYIEIKNAEKVAAENGLPFLKTGVGSLIFGIVAVVLSIIAASSDTGSAILMKVVTVIFGIWILLDGISFIKTGWEMKGEAIPGWLALVIMGVLIVLCGAFCIIDIFTGLTAVSTMYGVSMMMFGCALLVSDGANKTKKSKKK